jgi:hypothetical protein
MPAIADPRTQGGSAGAAHPDRTTYPLSASRRDGAWPAIVTRAVATRPIGYWKVEADALGDLTNESIVRGSAT